MNILIIQSGTESGPLSGEATVIEDDREILSTECNVIVEYIKTRRDWIGRVSGLLWSFNNYKKITSLIEIHNPDVVHFHTTLPYLSVSAIYAAKKKKVAIVQTLHNGRWVCIEGGFFRCGKYCSKCVGTYGLYGVISGCKYNRLVSFLFFLPSFLLRKSGKLFGLVDRFVAVSDFVKEVHVNSGFPENKIKVINNSVNADSTDGSTKAQRGGVAFAGRVSSAKGVDVLKYLAPVVAPHPLYIVGDGERLKELQSFCDLNEYRHVIFLGKKSRIDTLEILKKVTLTIVPSQCGESFSMVAAESMSLGTPVVASDLGGMSKLVQDGGGLIVSSRDFNEFSKSVLFYLEHPVEASIAGLKGREYALKNLSGKAKGEALIRVYKSIRKECQR